VGASGLGGQLAIFEEPVGTGTSLLQGCRFLAAVHYGAARDGAIRALPPARIGRLSAG